MKPPFRGRVLRKRMRGRAALKTSFSRSLSSSLRPPFQHVSVFKTPSQQELQIFSKFAILEPKFTKISVPKPLILQNFSFKATNGAKIQFFKPLFLPKNQFIKSLFFVPDRSLSPHLQPFGPHTISKMKVEYPGPPSTYMISNHHMLRYDFSGNFPIKKKKKKSLNIWFSGNSALHKRIRKAKFF